MSVSLAGTAAEEVLFGETSTGAEADIETATDIAREMAGRYGMSGVIGPVRISEKDAEVFLGRDLNRLQNVSPDTLSLLDQEVRSFVSEALVNAKPTIELHRDVVTTLADLLEVQETVEGDQLRKVLAVTNAAVVPYPAQSPASAHPHLRMKRLAAVALVAAAIGAVGATTAVARGAVGCVAVTETRNYWHAIRLAVDWRARGNGRRRPLPRLCGGRRRPLLDEPRWRAHVDQGRRDRRECANAGAIRPAGWRRRSDSARRGFTRDARRWKEWGAATGLDTVTIDSVAADPGKPRHCGRLAPAGPRQVAPFQPEACSRPVTAESRGARAREGWCCIPEPSRGSAPLTPPCSPPTRAPSRFGGVPTRTPSPRCTPTTSGLWRSVHSRAEVPSSTQPAHPASL